MRLSDAQIAEVRARADLPALAEKFGARLRRSGGRWIGSCPMCGGGKVATRFEIKADGQSWVCAVCHDGGDALRLIELARGCDFRSAVEFLGGPAQLSPEEEARLAHQRKADEMRRAALAERHRQDEIGRARRLWDLAENFSLDGVTTYLRGRGISALPSTADIRLVRAAPYFHGEKLGETGRREPNLLFRGPAMVAAIRDNSGEIVAAHLTYLAADFSRKARVRDPKDGADLPAKKVRGAKAGGHIVLRQPVAARRLFLGEGIETVLSVATALRMRGRLRAGDAFWSSVDLGNLGGAAVASVAHPALKTPGGRPARVPGPEPNLDAPSIVIPREITELILLGDGDSDPFTTRTTLDRAEARYRRPGLTIRIAMAPDGRDFNDLITETAA